MKTIGGLILLLVGLIIALAVGPVLYLVLLGVAVIYSIRELNK